MYTVGHSRIISVGAYTPRNVLTSREVMEAIDSKNRFDIDPTWLERTTGIVSRHVSDPGVRPSDMAVSAAKQAMELSGCAAGEIDAIVYSGTLRDNVEPSTAHKVQHKIGATNAIAFDITNACLGFMSAIHVVDSLIATGQARRGLIVTGEQGFHYARLNMDRLLKTHDRDLFNRLAAGLTLGDAGAAMILGPKLAPDSGIMQIGAASAGEHAELCSIENELSPIYTDMPPLFVETAKLLDQVYQRMTRERLKWHPEEIDIYIPHQVGIKGNKVHARTCGIDLAIIPDTVSSMGNIVSATIPYALARLHDLHRLKEGQKVFLSGTGSGISVAQAGVVWDAAA